MTDFVVYTGLQQLEYAVLHLLASTQVWVAAQDVNRCLELAHTVFPGSQVSLILICGAWDGYHVYHWWTTATPTQEWLHGWKSINKGPSAVLWWLSFIKKRLFLRPTDVISGLSPVKYNKTHSVPVFWNWNIAYFNDIDWYKRKWPWFSEIFDRISSLWTAHYFSMGTY